MVMPDDPIGIITINVAGSLNLLRAAMEAGVKTFIYCSSVSALGNFYEKEPVGEDYPLRPSSNLWRLKSRDGHGAARAVVGQNPHGPELVAVHRDLRSRATDRFHGRKDHQCGIRRQSRADRADDGLAVHLY